MSNCLQQLLFFDEDLSLLGSQISQKIYRLGSPLHKKAKFAFNHQESATITNPIELAALFGGMSHQGSAKHKLEEDGDPINYFDDHYDRHIYDRNIALAASQDDNAMAVSNNTEGTNIFDFLSPHKKINRSSSNDYYHAPQPKVSLEDTTILYDATQPEATHSPTSESIFARYEVIGEIDKGTFSKVLKVKEKNNASNIYALKKFKRKFTSFNDRKIMLHEVHMIAKPFNQGNVDCCHIAQCFLAWQEDSTIHMLMELSSNGSLKDLIDKCSAEGTRIPDKSLWKIAHDVSAGLHCIHSSGVVHLDIKPSNVLISSDGTLKIGDFGLATPIGGIDFDREGDCRYMALELLNENVRLPSADIYSFGLSLYELAITFDSSVGVNEIPTDGPMWHTLRNGQYVNPSGRSEVFIQLLHVMMCPVAEQRVSAEDIVNMKEVMELEEWVDPLLLSIKPRHAVDYTLKMSRSPSFDALNMMI